MTRCIFLEEDAPDLDLTGARIVALTPWAAASLKKRGISYVIPESFYSESEMRRGEDLFFEEQLTWVNGLDSFVSKNLPGAPPAVVSIHLNRIKYLVDSFLIRAYVAEKLFESFEPVSILHAGVDAPEPAPSIYEFKRRDRWSLAPLLKHLAGVRSVPWLFRATGRPVSEVLSSSGGKSSPLRRVVKTARNFFYYGKAGRSSAGAGKKRLLFLDAGVWAADTLIRDCIHAGHSVFLKQGKTIEVLHSLTESRIALQEKPGAFAPDLAEVFFQTEAFSQFSKGCMDLTGFLRPYFEDFFTRIVPDVVEETASMKKFLEVEKIDAVVARASVGRNYPSALMAAGESGIPRVCFQHSAGPADMKDWAYDELAFFDTGFAMSTPSAGYFSEQTKKFSRYAQCRVKEASQYLSRFSNQPAARRSKKPCLLYVPVKLAGGMSHFNTMFYPMTWYFEHQIELMKALVFRTDYDVIYKHAYHQEWADRSIIPWLTSHAPQIRIVQGVLPDFLPTADRVLFDYPSTGLFECAAAGLSVLALHHESMRIWDPMRDVFGASLQSFSCTGEAVTKTLDYLDRPAIDFCPKLPLTSGTYYQHLQEVLKDPVQKGVAVVRS